MTELIASGPLRYLGGSIETFALPMGTFIVAALVLFAIYRRPHNVPRLKYLRPAHQVALGTRDPGTEGPVVYVASATIAPPAATPEAAAPAEAPAAEAAAAAPAEAEPPGEAPPETEAAAEAHDSGAGPAESAEESPEESPEESTAAGHDGTSAEGETF